MRTELIKTILNNSTFEIIRNVIRWNLRGRKLRTCLLNSKFDICKIQTDNIDQTDNIEKFCLNLTMKMRVCDLQRWLWKLKNLNAADVSDPSRLV